MTKVVGSFQSVVRGVSEQVPQQRHSGQHYEQVNLLSDPVNGLARRHGSVTKHEVLVAGLTMNTTREGYARNYREFSFFVAGTEYSLVYQSGARTAGDTLPFAFALNKDTGQFLTVNVVAGAAMDPWRNGGVSAISMAGQFLVMAGNTVAPAKTEVDAYAASAQIGVAQIRAGAYSRTYTLKVKRASDGVSFTGTYTTMASSYPTLLSTSDIPAAATDYQKQVNDRVYAYNSNVTKWIGDASASIQPQNIAEQLRISLTAAGFINHSRVGGTLVFDNVLEATGEDGADGTGFRVTFNDLDDPAKLPSVHYPNKVVRITAKGAEPYYMVAVPENPSLVNWQNVVWKEGAAQKVTPTTVFALGVVVGTTLHIAATPAALATASGLTVPGFAVSSVGSSSDEGGLPYFFGKRISCLTVFQDRLCIIADGVIFASRTGDYFNWFRKSKLTLAADDPVEMFALGAEDDVIRHAVAYNKDGFLFGERKQYALNGRTALTPQNASVATAANERGTTGAKPVVLSNLVFYGKSHPAATQTGTSKFATEISQFQLGLFQDTPEAYNISQQLGLYLRGNPLEFAALPSPHTVVLRTDGEDFGLFLYNFLDQPGSQSRAFDSWHRWEWGVDVGRLIGVTSYKSLLYVYTLRTRGSETWVACEEFTLDSALADRPYLDMQRPAANFLTTGFIRDGVYEPESGSVVGTASAGDLRFMGGPISQYAEVTAELWPGNPTPPAVVGVAYDSFVDITPPYTRDRNDVAIVNGRLTINRYTVSVANTGGLSGRLLTKGTTTSTQVMTFNGRRVSQSNNLPSYQPVSDATLSVPIGRANTEHRVVLASVKWLPCTITAIEWVGQFFNNSRRV